MSTLRTRIEQRITDLRVERDIAAAADGATWEFGESDDSKTGRGHMIFRPLGDGKGSFIGKTWGWGKTAENAAHIATQDPATTIARIDRELAGCAADLALLDWIESTTSHGPRTLEARANLEARYPSEESS